MSLNWRLQAFEAGHYECPPPPVCSYRWGWWDWVKWIDAHGRWLTALKPSVTPPTTQYLKIGPEFLVENTKKGTKNG